MNVIISALNNSERRHLFEMLAENVISLLNKGEGISLFASAEDDGDHTKKLKFYFGWRKKVGDRALGNRIPVGESFFDDGPSPAQGVVDKVFILDWAKLNAK